MKLLLTIIFFNLLVIKALFPCMAGVEFLIKVNPALVDKEFYQQFSIFSQKIDDMAYFILNRNSTIALEKYNKAYSTLFNIYQKYFTNPPPFYSNKADFQKKLDYFTKKLSSFKTLIKSKMFATASDNLKDFVKEINRFLNPEHKWKKEKEIIKHNLSTETKDDLLYTINSIIISFSYSSNIKPQKIKLGKLEYQDRDLNSDKELKNIFQKKSKDFSFSLETNAPDLADLITSTQLQQNLNKKYDFIFLGEVLSPEVISEELKTPDNKLEKNTEIQKATFRYKIVSLKDFSIIKIEELTIGIKKETIKNLESQKKTVIKQSLGNPHRVFPDSFMQTGQQCDINKTSEKNSTPTLTQQNKKEKSK